METEQVKGGIEYSKAIKKIVARVLALSMFVVSAGMTVGCAGSAGSAGAGTAATTATASAAAATTDAASVTAASAASATTDAEATTTAATTAAAKPAEQTEEVSAYEPFFRIDRDDPDAWQEDLDNVRFLTEGQYELEEFDEQEYAPEGSPPSVEGLDTLNISGSAEFSEGQFRELAEKLRELADGKQLCVYDTHTGKLLAQLPDGEVLALQFLPGRGLLLAAGRRLTLYDLKDFHPVREENGLGYDLVAGANIAGFKKVADAMLAQGLI